MIHELVTTGGDGKGWPAGLQAIMRSSITEMIFQTMPMNDQFDCVDQWIQMKHPDPTTGKASISPDCWKILEDTLSRSPFSIPGIYSCLKEENNPLVVKERMHIVEKGMNDLNPMDFARFKISGSRHNEMAGLMSAFESIGRSEKALMTKL